MTSYEAHDVDHCADHQGRHQDRRQDVVHQHQHLRQVRRQDVHLHHQGHQDEDQNQDADHQGHRDADRQGQAVSQDQDVYQGRDGNQMDHQVRQDASLGRDGTQMGRQDERRVRHDHREAEESGDQKETLGQEAAESDDRQAPVREPDQDVAACQEATVHDQRGALDAQWVAG